MKVRITVEKTYARAVKRLPPDRGAGANAALLKFAGEPGLPGLDFRPLKGRPGYFIIDARRGDRIILRRDEDDLYAAIDVGPHDNIYRRWDR